MSAPSFVACLTPPGQGAIATLGLAGPQAWDAIRRVFRFRSGKALPAMPAAGRFLLGRVGDDVADDVVLIVKRTDPPACLELHTHGGREVVDWFIELIVSCGCSRCSWEEFHQHTTGDQLQARAAAALATAATVRSAGILLDQFHGAFAAALAVLAADLERGNLEDARRLINELADRARLGRRLTSSWRVVIAGAPNVGKSSLVNALAGFPRSVVAPAPGTTRDLVTTAVAVGGWPVELVDTAGLRQEAGPLEAQGIQLARDAAGDADLCLWVLDASAAPLLPAPDLRSLVQLVINKVDLPPAWDLASVPAQRISAVTGAGIPDLATALASWLVPTPPPAGAAVPFSAELCDAVLATRQLFADNKIAETRDLVATMRAGDIP